MPSNTDVSVTLNPSHNKENNYTCEVKLYQHNFYLFQLSNICGAETPTDCPTDCSQNTYYRLSGNTEYLAKVTYKKIDHRYTVEKYFKTCNFF